MISVTGFAYTLDALCALQRLPSFHLFCRNKELRSHLSVGNQNIAQIAHNPIIRSNGLSRYDMESLHNACIHKLRGLFADTKLLGIIRRILEDIETTQLLDRSYWESGRHHAIRNPLF